MSFIPSAFAENNTSVKINMIKEKTETRFNNPIIVAGIWHYINITLENNEPQELILKLYKGDSMPTIGERNATNYYEWKYDINSQTSWIDLIEYDGRKYMNIDNCSENDDTYNFCVGIKDTLPGVPYYYENWTLDI